MIKLAVCANEVIRNKPNKRKQENTYVEFMTNYISFIDDTFSYKVKNNPGKYSRNTIAEGIPANMYPGLFQLTGFG